MKKHHILIFFTILALAVLSFVGSWKANAKSWKPRVWVDVTGQSPNIFTNAEKCPADHPAQIWVLEETKYDSVGHHIRVCGNRNAKGELVYSDAEGKIVNP